jgi:hypothetical protein
VEEGREARGTGGSSFLIRRFVLNVIATGFFYRGVVAFRFVVRESSHVVCILPSEGHGPRMRTGKYLLFGMAIHVRAIAIMTRAGSVRRPGSRSQMRMQEPTRRRPVCNHEFGRACELTIETIRGHSGVREENTEKSKTASSIRDIQG